MFGSVAAAYTTLIIYFIYFMIHYYLAVKIHGAHLFRLIWLIVYAGILILVAALSLILRNVLVARWAILAMVCIIGALWADKEFGVFTVVKKKMKSH